MSKIKSAIIGCGRVAFHHELKLRDVDDIEVVAVCDLDQEKVSKLAEAFGCKAYQNYHEMLQKEDIDMVTIATPTGAHYTHAKEILENYKVHLMIEKPMVLKPSNGLELKRLADEKGVRLFPVYQNRFNPSVQRVKQAMESGELGELYMGSVRLRWCRPQRYYNLADWRGTYSMDGGAHVNQGIHFLDVLRYLCGEIEAVHSCFACLGAEPEAEDSGVSLIKFKNGGIGQIEMTTAARPTDYEASVTVMGSEGLAMVGGVCCNQLVTFSPNEEDQEKYSEGVPMAYGNGHAVIYKHIADAIINNKPAPVEFEDGLTTIRLLHALYRSSEDEQWVRMDDQLESARLGESNDELLAPYLTPSPSLNAS